MTMQMVMRHCCHPDPCPDCNTSALFVLTVTFLPTECLTAPALYLCACGPIRNGPHAIPGPLLMPLGRLGLVCPRSLNPSAWDRGQRWQSKILLSVGFSTYSTKKSHAPPSKLTRILKDTTKAERSRMLAHQDGSATQYNIRIAVVGLLEQFAPKSLVDHRERVRQVQHIRDQRIRLGARAVIVRCDGPKRFIRQLPSKPRAARRPCWLQSPDVEKQSRSRHNAVISLLHGRGSARLPAIHFKFRPRPWPFVHSARAITACLTDILERREQARLIFSAHRRYRYRRTDAIGRMVARARRRLIA